MDSERRLEIYLRGLIHLLDGDGFYRLTPKQRRRLNKKARSQLRRDNI